MDTMDTAQDTRELSFDDIVAVDDIGGNLERFETPEWRGFIWLRRLSAADVIQFNRELRAGKTRDDAMVAIFTKAACDRNGVLLVRGQEQFRKLLEKSTAPFMRAQTRIMQMNGMMTASKSWEQLQPLLEKAGVDADVIKRVQTEWATEADAKNV